MKTKTVLLITMWLTSMPSHALYRGFVIKSDTQNPIEREIALRTVRVEVAAGECTGVLINPRTVRTAGHCFALGGSLVGVRIMDGSLVRVSSTIKYIAPPRLFPNAASPDQAEIRFSRGIAAVGEMAILDPRHLRPNDRLIVAGYGPTDEDNVEDEIKPLSYIYATLKTKLVIGVRGVHHSYELHPESEDVFFTDGDSGGPAFVERHGVLKLIGNVSGEPQRRAEELRPAVIRPIGDLRN